MPDTNPIRTTPFAGLPDRDAMAATLAQHWWAIALRGVVAILFGVVALTAPGAVLLSLAFLFGIYLLIDGVIGLVSTARTVFAHGHWGTLLAEAVLNLLMGVIALALPEVAVTAFIFLMGAWAVLSGGLMIAAAVKLHATHGRLWLAVGGAASVLWGVLLFAAPMIGAVVVTWWLGAYAIVFGVALLACGWRLRGQHIG